MTGEAPIFPADFVWGAATSAFQIEGSPLADGAGPSNWYRFSHLPGRIHAGHTADVACDHYNRFADDVALMARLGLTAYRFSISWSRVLPEGRGRRNPAGLGFYDRLVDRLLESGIAPCPTLFHWDLPAALDDAGGWLNRDSAEWFGEYAALMFAALGDRVPRWSTLNEPWVVMDGGYLFGVHAPGRRSRSEAALAAHNLMRAHGTGVRAFRSGNHPGDIGLVVNLEPKEPASDAAADVRAAARSDSYMNRWFLDGALLGSYPDELAEVFGADWPRFDAGDFALMSQPIDFVGINYYTRGIVRDDPAGVPLPWRAVSPSGRLYTETGWEVHPASLTRVLTGVRDRYGDIPLYITENGAAFADPDTGVADPHPDPLRTAYLADHLRAAHAAMAAGVNLRGYFAWSLLDNFEWAAGFSKRFGLVHVDYATQKRTPKESALLYRDVIATRGGVLGATSPPA
jgi:beta-glucosidase